MSSKKRFYELQPARGQALLNFQGRLFPAAKMELFEVEKVEEVRATEKQKLTLDKQNLPVKEESLEKAYQLEKQGLLVKEGQVKNQTNQNAQNNSDFQNMLIQGDCLSSCAYLKSKNIKIDLVYIDPPFASGADYAKKIYLRNGGETALEKENSIGEEILYGDIWQKEDYLNWLYERLLAIREVMSETASIYVHLDWHIGHYVKVMLDEVFGEENFVNEVIWKYDGPGSPSPYKFSQKHETIFRYAKSVDSLFIKELYYEEKITKNEGEKRFKQDSKGRFFYTLPKGDYSEKNISKLENEGRIEKTKNGNVRIKYFVKKQGDYFYKKNKIQDVWTDIQSLGLTANTKEKTNYPTQKPEKLLERIIKASSDEGMLVADFFSGSGTTAKVANDLNRKFIACDVGLNALQTTRDRLVQKSKSDFDILKIQDGVQLFRNPIQTKEKVFSLLEGFKTRQKLDLSEFWDGGLVLDGNSYKPIKFIGIQERLTVGILDLLLEEITILEDNDQANEVILLYSHKDLEINQNHITKKAAERSEIKIKLLALDELLAEKKDSFFTKDNATLELSQKGNEYLLEIQRYSSPYLKNKLDEYNLKSLRDNPVSLSSTGLELIEAVQIDTSLGEHWQSNLKLEEKATPKEKIKTEYLLNTNKFKIKIRNIAGDEIILTEKNTI